MKLSTVKAIYPQIIATYPQISALETGSGGFPYPVNVEVNFH